MVEPAPAFHARISSSLAGGGNRVRTGDPELAKLVLYQLSYAPSTFAARPQAAGLSRRHGASANADRQSNETMHFEPEMV